MGTVTSGGSSPAGDSPWGGSSPSALRSSSRSRRSWSSHSEISLPVSLSAGTTLPTSVVDRKSGTARLHLPSARRSWRLDLPSALPPPSLLQHLRLLDLLLVLPFRAHLEEVLPRLRLVPAPPALWGRSSFHPIEILPGKAMPLFAW